MRKNESPRKSSCSQSTRAGSLSYVACGREGGKAEEGQASVLVVKKASLLGSLQPAMQQEGAWARAVRCQLPIDWLIWGQVPLELSQVRLLVLLAF